MLSLQVRFTTSRVRSQQARSFFLLAAAELLMPVSMNEHAIAAANAVNDFTRARMREDGFFRRIMPPIAVSNYELDRMVDSRPVEDET